MNYLKSIVKNVYQKVIDDDCLEQITEEQLYQIINHPTPNGSIFLNNDSRKGVNLQPEQYLYEKVQQIGNVSLERQLRVLGGTDIKFDVGASRIKQLTVALDEVATLMRINFHIYEKQICSSIDEIDKIKNIFTTKQCTVELRKKIKKLQQATLKSKRIAELHIKKQNIKLVLKTLMEIPNIKKMSLTQLKGINIDNIRNRSMLRSLKCLQGLENFIEGAVAAQFTQVLNILQQCITNQFKQQLYENALRDFMAAQHEAIKYEMLLIKLVEKQIRKIDSDVNGDVNRISQIYIKIMINLFWVFRWHGINERQKKWKEVSLGCYGISIEIDIGNVTKKVTGIMDECFKDSILHKFYHNEGKLNENLQNLYLICRVSQIAYIFSGWYLNQTLQETTEYLYKILIKTKQRAQIELQQTLKNQQRNNWNRLPVVDDYSHEVVDRTMYQIYRHRGSDDYRKVIEVVRKSKQMLMNNKIMIEKLGDIGRNRKEECNLWENRWVKRTNLNQLKQKLEMKQSGSPIYQAKNNQQPPSAQPKFDPTISYLKQKLQTWQSQQVHFSHSQKYQKHKQQIKLKRTSQSNYYTIICQYSLNMLRYIEIFAKCGFYYPIEPMLSGSLDAISYQLEYYAYNLFNLFLSVGLKSLFFIKYEDLQTLDQKYHKKSLQYQYPTISKFIINYENRNREWMVSQKDLNEGHKRYLRYSQNHSGGISSNKQISSGKGYYYQGNINGNFRENFVVRNRVVALESFSYLIAYYQHIMKISGFYKDAKVNPASQTNKEISSPIQQTIQNQTIADLHPELSHKIGQKLLLYQSLFSQLSQLIYTDCIPKLCNLKNTCQLIALIKWNDDQQAINQYSELLGKTFTQFYHKMNSSNRGQVPIQIAERLFGVFWKIQLSAIIKVFTMNYKNNVRRNYGGDNSKYQLERFIDLLYCHVGGLINEKLYLRVPYEKCKEIFPILMEKYWEKVLEMIKGIIERYEYVYEIQIGIVEMLQSCSNLSKDEIEEKKKIIEEMIIKNLQMKLME